MIDFNDIDILDEEFLTFSDLEECFGWHFEFGNKPNSKMHIKVHQDDIDKFFVILTNNNVFNPIHLPLVPKNYSLGFNRNGYIFFQLFNGNVFRYCSRSLNDNIKTYKDFRI